MEPTVSFEYLYRDGANYKNWGEVVLKTTSCPDINEINQVIRKTIIDGQNFIAESMNIPTLYFPIRDQSIDHDWHEFTQVILSSKAPTDKRTLDEFLDQLQSTQKNYK